MNESEAELEANRINEARKDVFCPLIREECIPSCECYVKSKYMREACLSERDVLTDGGYSVYGGYCTCHALKAELQSS